MGVKRIMETFFAGMQDQSMSGFGGRIVNTPMGPFRWNDTMQLWENVNNGMVMNNISFQDSMMMMDYASYDGGSAPITSVTPFTPGNTSYILYVNFAGATLGTQFSFLRTGSASYLDSSGLVKTVSGNTPRFNVWSQAPQGLVIEQSRTNYLRYNDGFSVSPSQANGGWALTNCTRTVDGTVYAPDGNTGACYPIYLRAPVAVPFAWISSTVSTSGVTANDFYTGSVWLRARTATSGTINIVGTSGPNQITIPCDLRIISGPGSIEASPTLSEPHWKGVVGLSTSEWTRIEWTPQTRLTATNWSNIVFRVAINYYKGAAYGNAQVGTGDSIYIWGAQYERGNCASSFISAPSLTTVTRNADNVFQQTGLTSWFSGASGTFALEFNTQTDLSGTSLNRQLLLATSSLSNKTLFVGYTGGTQNLIFGSQTKTVIIPGLKTSNKLAFSYTRGTDAGITASLNGGLTYFTIGNISSLGTGAYGDWLTIGCCGSDDGSLNPGDINTSSFTRHMNGTISSFKYWNKVLSSSDLQAETD
jgi:hypothetical protein